MHLLLTGNCQIFSAHISVGLLHSDSDAESLAGLLSSSTVDSQALCSPPLDSKSSKSSEDRLMSVYVDLGLLVA